MSDNNKVPEDKSAELPAEIMMYRDDRIDGLLRRATHYQIDTGSFPDGSRIGEYVLRRTGTIKASKLEFEPDKK